MTRPEKGTPEWDLWVAAIDVAADPPLGRMKTSVDAKVAWRLIDHLRDALDALDIDWRTVKEKEGRRR